MRRPARQNRRQRRLTSAKTRKTSKPIAEIPVPRGLSEPDWKLPGSERLDGGGCSRAKLLSKFNNRECFEDFRSKQASGEKKGAARSKFDSFRRWLQQ